jgi:hypothetical protein
MILGDTWILLLCLLDHRNVHPVKWILQHTALHPGTCLLQRTTVYICRDVPAAAHTSIYIQGRACCSTHPCTDLTSVAYHPYLLQCRHLPVQRSLSLRHTPQRQVPSADGWAYWKDAANDFINSKSFPPWFRSYRACCGPNSSLPVRHSWSCRRVWSGVTWP